MNKVYGKQTLPKKDFPFKSYDKFFCEEWTTSFLVGHKEKNFSFPICAVNFCKTFCTCFPSSLGQDLTVKNAIFFNFFFIWAS
jgi:hypothetical protein